MKCPTCSVDVTSCDSCGATPPKLEHMQYEQKSLHLCPNCAPRLQQNPEMMKKVADKKAESPSA